MLPAVAAIAGSGGVRPGVKQSVEECAKAVPLVAARSPSPLPANGEAIILPFPTLSGLPPLADNEPLRLQMPEHARHCGLTPPDGTAGLLEDAADDLVTVGRPVAKDVQHNEVVRARREVFNKLVGGHE